MPTTSPASATATPIFMALLGSSAEAFRGVEALQGASTPPADEPIYPHIKTVHVINSCHLDIGFADSSANIINRYFEHHLPLAASVGAQMAQGGGTGGYENCLEQHVTPCTTGEPLAISGIQPS